MNKNIEKIKGRNRSKDMEENKGKRAKKRNRMEQKRKQWQITQREKAEEMNF